MHSQQNIKKKDIQTAKFSGSQGEASAKRTFWDT